MVGMHHVFDGIALGSGVDDEQLFDAGVSQQVEQFFGAAIALIGCQPLNLEDWGGPLTAPVAASIGPAMALAADILAGWGVAPVLRTAPLPPESGLLGNDIDRAAYERPRADAS